MNKTLLLSLTYFHLFISLALAQDTPNIANEPTCFQVNISKLSEGKKVELPHTTMCLQYDDTYGKDDQLKVSLYDWQYVLIKNMHLPKKYGRNDYTLKLEEYGVRDDNKLYYLSIENEFGKKKTLSFRIMPPPDKPDPIVDIFINPVLLECESLEGNLIEFYGNIEGGKAPYDIRWILLGENKSSLLYQPKELKVEKSGYTPTIQVDKSPNYMVMLQVVDACGRLGEQIVNIQCDKNIEKTNTLFLQPLPEADKPTLFHKL